MIRPAESLEVYKQKQNILFIYESVEHRRSKVTWARLCVCTAECACRARGPAVREASAWIFILHDLDGRAARFGRGARLGRDASTVRPRRTDWLHTG